jgi:DNA-directed RNA polymerase I, II, and III subunit RPABC1
MDDFDSIKKCWNTCLELVNDRGYMVKDQYYELGDNDLKYMVTNNKVDIICKNTNNDKNIYIKFLLAGRIKPSIVKEVLEEMGKKLNDSDLDINESNLEIIIIIRNKPNNSIFRLLKDYNNVQIMWLNQLKFNPTRHFIVPEHIKLSEEESKEIIKNYSLSSKFQLPLLLKEDAISRYYNFKVGDIIKIRQSITCQNKNYVFYRCVR